MLKLALASLMFFGINTLANEPTTTAPAAAAAAAAAHTTHEGHTHKHGKKCGHKAEKHGDHTWSFDWLGLDAAEQKEMFARYCATFGVTD